MEEVSKGHDSARVVVQPANYDPEVANQQRIAEAEARKQAEAEIEQMIEADKLDPRQQWYLKNVVTGKLIKTHADYHFAENNHHPLKRITYNQAYDLFMQEKAAQRQALAKQLARKRAKAARKRNRPK